MVEFPKSIKDGDIELRQVPGTFDTANAVYALVDGNRTHFSEFLGWVKYVNSPEDQFDWVSKSANSKMNYLIYVDNKLVGAIGFVKFNIEEDKRWAEIGYWIDASVSGRGVMTRSVKIIERLAFETGDLNRVQIQADDLNIASCRVAEKAGYKLEGILRAYNKCGTKSSGNIRFYSKLKSEWQAENKNA